MFIGKNRLRELRKKKNFTQEELAKRTNVHRSTISKYENNERSPDYALLAKFAEILGVSIDDLLGHEVAHTPSDNVPNSVDLTGLPETDAKKVHEYADLLKLKQIHDYQNK